MSLSRPALLLIGLLILLAILDIWSTNPVTGSWRLAAGMGLALVVWERWQLRQNFSLLRQISPQLELGIPAVYSITITNVGHTRLTLESQPDYPELLDGDNSLQRWQLAPNSSETREFTITPTRLGSCQLGHLYVRQLGRLGIVWWRQTQPDQTALTIIPVNTAVSNVQLAGRNLLGIRQTPHIYNHGAEFLDLSPYRAGDPLRSIDWKASARRGSTMVRRFSRDQHLDIVVLLDCGRGSRLYCGQLDRLHHYLNVAAKLAAFAAANQDSLASIAYAQHIIAQTPLQQGIRAVQTTRTLLTQLSPLNETANALNAALAIRQVLKHRGLVIFLTDIEQPEAANQLIQATKLLAARHRVLVAGLLDPDLDYTLQQPAQGWQDPYRQLAALEYRYGCELSRKQLQAQGVATLAAPAELLDKHILQYYCEQRDRI